MKITIWLPYFVAVRAFAPALNTSVAASETTHYDVLITAPWHDWNSGMSGQNDYWLYWSGYDHNVAHSTMAVGHSAPQGKDALKEQVAQAAAFGTDMYNPKGLTWLSSASCDAGDEYKYKSVKDPRKGNIIIAHYKSDAISIFQDKLAKMEGFKSWSQHFTLGYTDKLSTCTSKDAVRDAISPGSTHFNVVLNEISKDNHNWSL